MTTNTPSLSSPLRLCNICDKHHQPRWIHECLAYCPEKGWNTALLVQPPHGIAELEDTQLCTEYVAHIYRLCHSTPNPGWTGLYMPTMDKIKELYKDGTMEVVQEWVDKQEGKTSGC